MRRIRQTLSQAQNMMAQAQQTAAVAQQTAAKAGNTVDAATVTMQTATQALEIGKAILADVLEDGITLELENTSNFKGKSLAELATGLLTGNVPSISFRLRIKP